MKFTFYFKYKKLVFNILTFALIFYLLLNSSILISSISNSIDIFIYKLIPAIFPYILITELLIHSNKIYDLSYGISSALSKIFKIPKYTTSIVIIGLLLGYPNAAKCILKMYNEKKINKKLATKLISFTSNANPSYIIATVGIGIFQSIEIGVILAVCHILSAVIIGIFFTPVYNTNIIQQTNINSNSFNKISSPFELLSTSILGSIKTLSYICAYTIIFALIPTIVFNHLNTSDIIRAVTIGMFEISNGINSVQQLGIPLNSKIILTSFILSFSSLMILFQIFTFASKAKVSFKELFKYKLLHGIISCIITYFCLKYLYSPTILVFNNSNTILTNFNILPSTIYMTSIIVIFFMCSIIFRKKRQVKPVA